MHGKPLYLNHAGTCWPRPAAVHNAVAAAGALPPAEWPDLFDACCDNIARYFQVPPDRLLMTSGGTAALTLAVDELPWQAGDRFLSTRFEHHALSRHLIKLQHRGVQVDQIPPGTHSLVDLEDLARQLTASPVKLLAMTAACNVTGQRLPLREVIDLAHGQGAMVLIDASQLVGWTELDLTQLGADLVAFAGHKALQGPWGIGGLYVAPHVRMVCPTATCRLEPGGGGPSIPGYCDAGSVNLTSLAGLSAACDWLRDAPRDRLHQGQQLAAQLIERLCAVPGIHVYHAGPADSRVPSVAFRSDQWPLDQLQSRLQKHNITASVGFQCAPWAHEALGTNDTGVVRVSFGHEPPTDAIDRLLESLG